MSSGAAAAGGCASGSAGACILAHVLRASSPPAQPASAAKARKERRPRLARCGGVNALLAATQDRQPTPYRVHVHAPNARTRVARSGCRRLHAGVLQQALPPPHYHHLLPLSSTPTTPTSPPNTRQIGCCAARAGAGGRRLRRGHRYPPGCARDRASRAAGDCAPRPAQPKAAPRPAHSPAGCQAALCRGRRAASFSRLGSRSRHAPRLCGNLRSKEAGRELEPGSGRHPKRLLVREPDGPSYPH